jgi:hypothetical protein
MSAFRRSDNLSDLSKPDKARRASVPADAAVINLKRLDALAKQLDPAEIEHERKLRRELKAVEGRLRMDRCEKGRILASYRAMYKPKGRWHAFCRAVGLNERSALRIIADYTAAKALPTSIREAANRRGIDIAAMKHRPLLEKLIDLGFEDGANADNLIQRGLDELGLKKKNQKPARSLSPEQRFGKAYDTFVSLYPDVNSASYLAELNKLYKALKSLYCGPIKKVPGYQVSVGLFPESEVA